MSDQLTHTEQVPPVPPVRSTHREWRVAALQALAIVLICLGLGAVGGVLWERLWTPSEGLVWQGKWYKGLLALDPTTFAQTFSENAHQDVFSGLAIYVVISLGAGILIGAVSCFVLARRELVTLVALFIGGLAGGTLMARLGIALSPADPNVLAQHTPNEHKLPDRLQLVGTTVHVLGLSLNLIYLVFPGAALLALAVVFLGFDGRRGKSPELEV